MVELAVGSYAKTICQGKVSFATGRAGNVIGGGDFSDHRIIPDAITALIQKEPIEVRNPNSIRPWLHVLDPLHGYLMLAKKITENKGKNSEAWNFGPLNDEAINVQTIVEKVIELWGQGDWVDVQNKHSKPEMKTLRLNWDKAASLLQWHPNYNWEEALGETVDWYKSFATWMTDPASVNMREVCVTQIQKFDEKWKAKACNSILHP
jgi:CDP-glucose 4,6-dehydratase